MTLKELLDEHPEWGHLPIVVINEVGELFYVGASGTVYRGEGENDQPVLIFGAN